MDELQCRSQPTQRWEHQYCWKTCQKFKILLWIIIGTSESREKSQTCQSNMNSPLLIKCCKNFHTMWLKTTKHGPALLETVKAFHFVHDHYLEDADCFMEANYDTHVLLDNLTWLLSNYDPEESIYFKRKYVLKKKASKRFGTGIITTVVLQRVLVNVHLAVSFLDFTTVYKFDCLVHYLHLYGYLSYQHALFEKPVKQRSNQEWRSNNKMSNTEERTTSAI